MTDSIYKKNRKRYLLLMLPALLLYTFTLVIPLLGGTLPNSLTNWNLMKGTKEFVAFDNYVRLFHDKDLQQRHKAADPLFQQECGENGTAPRKG